MGVAIIPMAADLGFSETTKGLIAAAFSLGYGLGIAPAGALVSKTGAPRRTLGGGLLAWSLAQAATAPAAPMGIAPLLASRTAMGVGEAACLPSLQLGEILSESHFLCIHIASDEEPALADRSVSSGHGTAL